MPSDGTDNTDPDDVSFEFTTDMDHLPDEFVDAIEDVMTEAAQEAFRQMKKRGPTQTPEADDAE